MVDKENKRNKQLIQEREEYEKAYFSQIIDDMIDSDALDKLIHDRFQYFDEHFDFEPSPEYQRLEEIYYTEYESSFKETNPFDEIDYPEGPDENLEGIRYDEPLDYSFEDDFIDYEPIVDDQFVEIPDDVKLEEERVSNQIENYNPYDFYDDILDEIIQDEDDLKKLIEEHVKDEKDFFDSLLIDAIQEQHYFERAIEDLIIEHFEEDPIIDFEMDYEDYWYDEPFEDYTSEVWPYEDESIIDPFDSLGDIDYPEGGPKFRYPEVVNYDDELQRDFEKYQRKKEYLFGYSEEELPDPDDDLILDVPDEYLGTENNDDERNPELIENREKIESLYKDYFTRDDTLDNLIKDKLKEKKFNI